MRGRQRLVQGAAGNALSKRRNYLAPLVIYRDLFYRALTSAVASSEDPGRMSYVCTAGEWHRFLLSFFVLLNYRLGF